MPDTNTTPEQMPAMQPASVEDIEELNQDLARESRHNTIYRIVWLLILLLLLFTLGFLGYLYASGRGGRGNTYYLNKVDANDFLRRNEAASTGELTVNANTSINGDLTVSGNVIVGGSVITSTGASVGGSTFINNNFFNAGCVQSVICNSTIIEPNKNFAIQSASSGSIGGVIKAAAGQTADMFQLQNAGGTVLDTFTAAGFLGVNTGAPATNLHVQGSEIITGHSAIGPNATLGDGILVTPLPAPFGLLQARRTQYVAEIVTDLSTAPPLPGAYAGQGVELLLNPTTDPSAYLFAGQYSTASISGFNPEDFGSVMGNITGVTHRGIGTIALAAGTTTGNLNLNGGTITSSNGVLVGTTNDVGGTISSANGILIFPAANNGTITSISGITIIDQASWTGTTAPVTAANISTTGAALNYFGGSTMLNGENSASLTADLFSPYNATTRWPTSASDDLPASLRWMGYAQANGYLYITGGDTGAGPVSTVYYAKFSGSTVTWTATTPLPAARSAHRTFVQNGYIYVVGGGDGVSSVATVYYARLNADGSVGAWKTTTSLPGARSFAGGAQYNGNLYILAGVDVGNTSSVFYTIPNSDGSISSWTTSATPLPTTYARVDAAVANGFIYYLNDGGFTTYYASLNPDGSNNAWSTASTSPVFGTAYHTAFINSGSLIRVGGQLVGVSQEVVSSAPLLPSGDLGEWTEHASDLPVAREGQALFNVNGNIVVVGGEDTGTVVDNVYTSATRKVTVAGALDLASGVGAGYADYGAATSLSAGNTDILGLLSVYGDTSLRGRLSTLADVNFAGDAQLGADINFDAELAHAIKLGDSTTAATAGANLSILGANGNGAVGGNILLDAGTGTTAGDILLNTTSTGFVGIANATPTTLLYVGSATTAAGAVATFENSAGVCTVNPGGGGFSAGVACTSDQRLKKNITNYTDSLTTLGAINVVNYQYLTENESDTIHVGVVAQELEAIVPDLVTTNANGYKAVNYAMLTPYLVKGLQQQQTQINELKTKVDALPSAGVSVDVVAELAKAKVITLNGNLVVNGRVEFSAENKGLVKVPVGNQKLKVDFVSLFAQKPNVVISPNDFVDGAYKTTQTTTGSFTIELNKPQTTDVEFNWQAF